MTHQDLDDELQQDLMGGFEDAFNEIEAGLASLEHAPSTALVDELFRAIHSIKGNAGMAQLDGIVDYTHHMENVFSRLRDGTLQFTSALGEAIHIGMDRLKDLHHRDILGVSFQQLDTQTLGEQFSALSKAEQSSSSLLIDQIRGVTSANESSPSDTKSAPNVSLTPKQEQDLSFFQELSLQLDKKCHYWDGRSIQIFLWAQKLNEYGGSSVAYEQLAAACYLHDFGMMFLPEEVLEKTGSLSPEEIQQIRTHTGWGTKLLTQIPGWSEASTIVDQHHEFVDGNGYPSCLDGDSIHDGAKIIAIIDAFFSMINGRPDRSVRRTALRAVSEINARKNTQFCAHWVDLFNTLLKDEIRAGHI